MSTVYALGAWATAEEFFAADMCDCVTLDPVTDAEMVDDALDYAADALARMSGMRYLGTTERTLARPNIGCLTCGPYCITLRGPVIEVTAAWENGVLLTEDDYRLIGDQVHRIDADYHPKPWGRQNIFAPHTEPGTLAFSYSIGRAPSWVERTALFEVACDTIKAWSDGRPPAMPGVTSVSGGGVSLTVDPDEEPTEPVEKFPAVARFLSRWNPRGDVLPAVVFSPDMGTACGSCSCC